jgi:hypothetical protein
MKVAEKIITEEGGATLQKCVVELEEENSRLRVTAAELWGQLIAPSRLSARYIGL